MDVLGNASHYFRPISAGLSAACLLLTLGTCVYRLFLHPYARHPGPFLAKLTSWYSVYHTYVGDLHTDIWKCHERYGDIVRYGPNRILINTADGLKDIYGHGKNVQKAKSYLRISLIPGVHPTLGTIDNKKHGRLRRIINQGLSDSHIRTMDSQLKSLAMVFAEGLGEERDRFETTASTHIGDGWSSPKDVAKWCDFFTFDVMSQLVFGASYDMLNMGENHWIINGVSGQMRRISFLTQLPELEDLGLHKLLFPQARRKAFNFSQKSRQILEERQQRDKETVGALDGEVNKKDDLFSKLLSAKDPDTGEGLSQKQLWAESNLLIIAGSDTSSTGLAAVFFYLSRNPVAYRRVTEEVRQVFPCPEKVNMGPDLLSCTYLRACIQEALRMVPAAGGAMWREALPGGLQINARSGTNIYVPQGLEVATGIWSLNHSAEYFPEPFAYRPERWIPREWPADAVASAKAAFATFSHGPRNCVGKGLAMVEISLAMAVVISGYDFRRAYSQLGHVGEGEGMLRDQYQTFWAFTSFKDGPFLQFKPVEM